MTRAVDDLFNGHLDLFIPCRNATVVGGSRANADRWVPNPKYAQPSPRVFSLYDFIGRLMGLSLRQRLYLGFPLAGMIWKSLCNELVDLESVAEVDQPAVDCINSVAQFLSNSATDSGSSAAEGAASKSSWSRIGSTSLAVPSSTISETLTRQKTFTVPGADGADVELVPGGRSLSINADTVVQYVALATQFKTREFSQQIDAIRTGLAAIIPPRAITLCTSAGLELRVCGDSHVDIDTLKAHTVYNGYFKVRLTVLKYSLSALVYVTLILSMYVVLAFISQNDRVPTLFWRVLTSFNDEQRGRFVRFAWGRSRLPLAHQRWEREFKLSRADGRGDESLPLAHTCFFHVELPAYSSEAVMRARLLATIK